MLSYLIDFDQRATLALNALYVQGTDAFWQFFSAGLIWWLLCSALVAFLFARLGWKRALVTIGACILTAVLCETAANLSKYGLERLRPCWDEDMLAAGLRVLEGKGGRFGFFSAHSANAAGLALCSLLCLRSDSSYRYRGYAWFAFGMVLLIGISRVFVGKHFLGDVLAGFSVGLLIGWLAGWLARRIMASRQLRDGAGE